MFLAHASLCTNFLSQAPFTLRTAPYGTVRRRRTLHVKLYATYRCCRWAQLRCRLTPSARQGNGDAVCEVNAAVEINVLDYYVAVRHRTCLTAPYVVWTGFQSLAQANARRA